MLDFLVLGAMIAAGVKISQLAKERGRSQAWALIVVPAAGLPWVIVAVLASVLVLLNSSGGTASLGSTLGVSAAAALAALLGLGAAYFVISRLSPVSTVATDTVQPAASAGAPALQGMSQAPSPRVRRAGYCMDCGQNVWLTGAGSCPNGHGPQSLTNCYSVEE